MGVLAAERIKITSTKSPWWCTVAIIVLGLGLAFFVGLAAKLGMQSYENEVASGNTPDFDPYLPTVFEVVGSGVGGMGVMVLMILAALTVTSEYRFGIIRTTFQAIPNRASVLVAKASLIGVFGFVLSFVLGILAFYVGKAVAGPDAGALLSFDVDGTWRVIYGTAILAFLQVFVAVGVGALLRQSAGAIALLLLWPLLVESLFGLFGSFGRAIQPFLPFGNANHFLGQSGGVDYHWGPWGSLIYFIAFTAIVFGAALFVTNRRDA
ncbi:ABC transporter permease [Rhodococcus sp. BP-252]|uniref:ABC transporter permease n=1 Tax=unclassified Rhodococcus (in: high G+C Gram-positive bacteria) TaxID=192944 RepID=UPI001C9B6ECA|nr:MULTISPECIES: ABC transporter permease [unclassified Rhodococcus (in: high G+C Gram-positive bacteria)]MBY6414214.1 ABC transporter permease [Rhodococcus sp. BP-320]MBY6418984.1 ABC transporter permease [Rhodococcus sp. BP-321]MBY6423093.1 ABC transporter permease [Rhodococcus sp. BP-324]MBY6429018.1 ABC transporter permease [Rhodococcus sp. BP-323]MBY6434024.1 ABC transporter permease [Rhodococcus sp. BP-322]